MPPRRSARNVSSKTQTKRPSHLSPPDQHRQIKRQKSSQEVRSTPTTSKYFDKGKSSNSPESNLTSVPSDAESAEVPSRDADSAADAYTGGESGVESTGVSSAAEEDYSGEEEYQASGQQGRRKTNRSGKQGRGASSTKGQELWREGIRTGLGPGKEVFIKLPGPRDDGGISYEDGTIHPNTVAFLKDLKQNNEREWLKREQLTHLVWLSTSIDILVC